MAVHVCSRPDAAPQAGGKPLHPVATSLTDTRGPGPVHSRIPRDYRKDRAA